MDLQDILKDKIDELDIQDLVRNEIRSMISDDIRRSIKDTIRKKIEEIIQDEIEVCMKGSIKTDDGWGKIEEYPNFESLFKKEFKDRLDKNWEMKIVLEKAVKERVSSLMNQNMTEVVQKFVDLVSGTVLKTGTKI